MGLTADGERVHLRWVRLLSLLLCLTAWCAGPSQAAKPLVGGGGGAGNIGVFAPAPLLPPPPVPPQFDVTGFIQEATLDTSGAVCRPSDPRLAGGTLKVNGLAIVVPCNTILQMPAATVTWQELFSMAPRDIGLPMGDTAFRARPGSH